MTDLRLSVLDQSPAVIGATQDRAIRDTIEIAEGLAPGERVVSAREPRSSLNDGDRIGAP